MKKRVCLFWIIGCIILLGNIEAMADGFQYAQMLWIMEGEG